MTCADFDDLALLALYGEAGPEDLRRVEDHRIACEACRLAHDDRARVVALGRALGPHDPPPVALERVLAAARPRGPGARFLATAIAAGLAAGTILALPAAVPPAALEAEVPEVAEAEVLDDAAVDRRVETLRARVETLRADLAPLDASRFDARATTLAESVDRLRLEIAAEEF